MFTKKLITMLKELLKLQSELRANKGIMPESWKPYAKLIIELLSILELFVNSKWQAVIAEIITAIEAAEDI